MGVGTGTHEADDFVEDYREAFQRVYGQEPRIYYMGNRWYQVNGKPLHHTVLVVETERLHDLANMRYAQERKRSVIGRIVKRLRGETRV